MSVARLIHHRALAILWSAGLDVPMRERSRIGSAAMGVALDPGWISRPQAVTEAACRLLASFGYECDPTKEWADAMAAIEVGFRDAPTAGDAVLVDGDGGWMGVRRGQSLVLSDLDGTHLRIGAGSHRITEGGMIVMTSGGPASIGAFDLTALRPTDEIARVPMWRFSSLPAAGEGVEFVRRARRWLWDGAEAALTPLRECA